MITVPVTGRSSPPLGALFFIRGPESPHFDRGHFSVAQLLSRQVAAALEAQLDPATGLYARAALHSAVGRWAARLREVGVDYVQGDGVEKPRPLPDVLESLGAESFARNNRRSRS